MRDRRARAAVRPSRAAIARPRGVRQDPPSRAASARQTRTRRSLGRPREVRGRKSSFALVRDPETVDLRPRGTSHIQLRTGRMEDAREPRRLAVLHPEWHDIFDLEVHGVTDPDRVAQTFFTNLDRRALHAE